MDFILKIWIFQSNNKTIDCALRGTIDRLFHYLSSSANTFLKESILLVQSKRFSPPVRK